MNKKSGKIIAIIVIIILILMNLAIFIRQRNLKKNDSSTAYTSNNESVSSETINENSLQEQISQMGERNRMQTYFGEYISEIEDKDYEKAYSFLNDKFKAKYFPDESKFEDYVKGKYPSQIAVNYTNIDRQGDLYVLTYEVSNPFDSTYAKLTQRAVIKENGNNDFKVSFQVN